MKKNSDLSFRVSSGLKNLIGRDLISDKYIAVFELVKNSYDAGASKVEISYLLSDNGDGKIIISDNGMGMTYDDILKKWLFVAYSEKKPQNRKATYREEIKREIAGAKGVGRFSCDRLGASLHLATKVLGESTVHAIDVDWNQFEYDDTKEFMQIPVKYSEDSKLVSGFQKGTSLIVTDLRESWERSDLLKLKHALMKLISPDADKGELPFEIEMIVPAEMENDQKALQKQGINVERDIVNGIIHNDIFEKLNLKTTNIDVVISSDGKTITSTLSDRGEYIFTVKEKNKKYGLLKDIHITVFYLNQKAKVNFTKQMGGVTPKSYGSVFIYKNGFRIYPYGDPGQDLFGIDIRKAQGWKRFLGTREIMGRISIKGDNNLFIETTSRAHGFIQTPAVDMLADLFVEKVLKVLEKYVVNLINWGEPLKASPESFITPEDICDEIISQFITNINSENIISVNYNPNIIKPDTPIKEQDSIVHSLKKLEVAAEKTQDSGLLELAQVVKKRAESILKDNIQLEADAENKAQELEQIQHENEVRKKQIYFLEGTKNQDVTNLMNGFHTVYTLTDAVKGYINLLRNELSKERINEELIWTIIGGIYQANEKARKLADLAIHGNQSLKQEQAGIINELLRQYIEEGLAIKGISYEFDNITKDFVCKFDTTSIGVILDNLASNSIKAGATKIVISFSETARYVEVSFADDGMGLKSGVVPNTLFEWGWSDNVAQNGSGIGLYHVKQLVTEMKGTINIDTTYKDGFKLIIGLRK